jgi:hypothetical protein
VLGIIAGAPCEKTKIKKKEKGKVSVGDKQVLRHIFIHPEGKITQTPSLKS